MTKRVVSILFGLFIIINCLVYPIKVYAFVDIPDGFWAKSSIDRWQNEKIITGYEDNTFRAQRNITRAEFVTMIDRILLPSQKANLSVYTDINPSNWYYDSFARIVNLGIINGVSNNELAPTKSISRQEVMTILYRIISNGEENIDELDIFKDKNEVATWAKPGVAFMIKHGIINGYEDGTIKPNKNITRAEVAKILDKTFVLLIKDSAEYDLKGMKGNIVILSNNVKLLNFNDENVKIIYSEYINKESITISEKDNIDLKDDSNKEEAAESGGSAAGGNTGSSGAGENTGSSGTGGNTGGSGTGENTGGSGTGENTGSSGTGGNTGGSGTGENAGGSGDVGNTDDENNEIENMYYSVNGKQYATMRDAYLAIEGDKGTIKVLENVIDDSVFEFSNNKDIVIDTNGKTITKTKKNIVINKCKLTITGKGRIETVDGKKNDVPNLITLKAGELIINGPTLENKGILHTNWVTVYVCKGNLTLNSGKIIASNAAQNNIQNGRGIAIKADSKVTIKEGTVKSTNGPAIIAISTDYGVANGTINIKNGEIISEENYAISINIKEDYTNKTNLNITGGNIKSNKSSAIYSVGIGTITLGEKDGVVSSSSPKVTGKTYAIESKNGFNFYDGVLYGEKAGHSDSKVKLEDGYEIKNTKSSAGYTETLQKCVEKYIFKLGGIDKSGKNKENTNRVRLYNNENFSDFIYVKAGTTITVDSADYKYAVATYSEPHEGALIAYQSIDKKYPSVYTASEDCYIKAMFARADDADLSNLDISEHCILNIMEGEDSFRDYYSKFAKDVSFGEVRLTDFYQGLGDDYALFNMETKAKDFFEMFNELVKDYPDYCTVNTMGVSADGITTMYYYEFKPSNANKHTPKIIIISGQHGNEKSSCYGLYYFVRDLLKDYKKDEALKYIRNNLHLIIAPCMNPYGFDNFKYKDINSVNLNRNYDVDFANWYLENDDISAGYYGGTEPFSEIETRMVRDLVLDNLDAFYFIDFHTNGTSMVKEYKLCNWHSLPPAVYNDPYLRRIVDAAYLQFEEITDNWQKEYNFDTNGEMCGSYTTNSTDKMTTSVAWARLNNITAATIEGFNGFPHDKTSHSSDVHKANSEIIGNWLKNLANVFTD